MNNARLEIILRGFQFGYTLKRSMLLENPELLFIILMKA